MRLNPYCMCCQLNKQEQRIRKFTDNEKKVAYMQEIMKRYAEATEEDCAPSLSVEFKEIYRRYWNVPAEDYTEIKKDFNNLMMNLEDDLERMIRQSSDPVESALIYARIGNYIDFAAMSHVDKDVVLSMIREEKKEALDPREYRQFCAELEKASSLVYLTDNCGEIVLDKIAVKILREHFPNLKITVIVRGKPVINDATMEDARMCGLTDIAEVIGNGSGVGGTWLPDISREARCLLEQADVILSKGQGNFETLHECGLNIYYLFLCKCDLFVKLFDASLFQGMFVNEKRLTLHE